MVEHVLLSTNSLEQTRLIIPGTSLWHLFLHPKNKGVSRYTKTLYKLDFTVCPLGKLSRQSDMSDRIHDIVVEIIARKNRQNAFRFLQNKTEMRLTTGKSGHVNAHDRKIFVLLKYTRFNFDTILRKWQSQ